MTVDEVHEFQQDALRELASDASAEQNLALVKLFKHGSWMDYKTLQAKLPPLTAVQANQLRKLTVVSLAAEQQEVSYKVLMQELDMKDMSHLEELLNECIADGLLKGRLGETTLHVSSCSPRAEARADNDLLPTGSGAAAVIQRALEHSNVHVFGWLLDTPQVQKLANTPEAQNLALLKLFAYGSWKDYKTLQSKLPPLTTVQANKLRRLTVVSLASAKQQVPYKELMQELDMKNQPDLEELLKECIAYGLFEGQLVCADEGMLYVSSCTSRDTVQK
mmetsp:Transcript_49967/g.99497  ORF Transcript_49967/g.99497 Transcript_49967/m.99497 type:complete len:277 (-) Transcript_49967:467-1297(-)|eukprot:CAMPEP_0174720514 /NCGR_PEP_ID=MMETSP1094-20130205/33706_1 /TAXON_ID=156173 /ORGANISM="Chrysochromulina brevifilum, Strain UTEX LB 985" /LENGTH=276 /DNA_ID=CAMNT_0015921005 /DNA_START=84 /DNA_END=914 /DNA_ORIENTATION=+